MRQYILYVGSIFQNCTNMHARARKHYYVIFMLIYKKEYKIIYFSSCKRYVRMKIVSLIHKKAYQFFHFFLVMRFSL